MKKFIVLLMALLMAFGMVACKDDGNSGVTVILWIHTRLTD